mgnify:CR=1 FL=1
MSNQNGIALFELLVSAMILSAGIIVVYQPLIASISGLHDADYRLAANRVLTEQLWGIQTAARRESRFPVEFATGVVTDGQKTYYFGYRQKAVSEDEKLYEVEGTLSWKTGSRSKAIKRTVYAATF